MAQTKTKTRSQAQASHRPSTWLTLLETRAIGEYGIMAASMPLLRRLPHGDGHPVLVLPGFMAGDRSTETLRGLLDDLGYRTYGWELGTNIGPTPAIVDGLVELFVKVARENPQPMSVIGWSLGGLYARAIARQQPDSVRQIMTLGSPLQMTDGDPSVAADMWNAFRAQHVEGHAQIEPEAEQPPLAMPSTAIYTRTDGIVPWRACLQREGPQAENIEVYGSHCGLGFNPAVAMVVADRLATPADQWQEFVPPLWMVGAFPPPASFEPRRQA